MHERPETIAFWVGRLPHWEVEEGRYFVTIHLAGAIPQSGQRRIREIAGQLNGLRSDQIGERLQVQRRIFEMERWLDRAQQCTHFARPDMAEMVVEAIDFRHQNGIWRTFEYVVMPNHLHLLIEPCKGRLKKALEDFKEWTGHRAGRLINLNGRRFWQREWFDHWVRAEEEFQRIVQYIRQNPVKAGLVQDYRDWQYGSWSGRSL